MSAVVAWALDALVASTLLMLAVLALRGPVRRAFGADAAYALWALPILRLALPPLPERWHAAAVAPVLRATERVTVLLVEPTAVPVAPTASWLPGFGDALPVLLGVWLLGAAAFALWHVVAHHRFCARMLADALPTATVGGIRVVESPAASGPLAFGVRRRYVAFPRDVAERYDADERDLALRHEIGHHARGDLLPNWIALAVLALHWFNPVAWRAFRAFRADQEIANDARVLAGMPALRRHAYACAIVKTAHPAAFGAAPFGAVSTACHLHTIDDLKGRLKMLTTTRPSRARRLGGTAALVLLTGGGLALTASGTAAAAAARVGVARATGIELPAPDQAAPTPPDQASPRVAPVPPTPPVYVEAPVSAAKGAASKRRYKIVVTEDGKTVSEHELPGPPPAPPGGPGANVRTIVIRDKDGKMMTEDFGAGMPPPPGVAGRPRVFTFRRDGRAFGPGALPPTPVYSSIDCSESGDGKPVIHDEKDGKRRILICTNRIERVSADGTALVTNGKDIERNAYLSALGNLRAARARMANGPDMSGDQRKAALDSIDTAIREVEGDLAKAR